MVTAKRIALVLLFSCAGAGAFGQALFEGYNLNLSLELSGIEEAGPPRMVHDRVLFTYQSRRPVRYVGIAFEHEEYREVHRFRVNTRPPEREGGQGSRVYFYLHEPPEDIKQLRYRLVVDGLWMADPRNGRTRVDANGIPVSLFDLPERPEREHSNPIVEPSGRVTFRLVLPAEGSPGLRNTQGDIFYLPTTRDLRVFLSGSFNNWDPYMYRLQPVAGSPGRYEITGLRLLPGRHQYYFIINGRRVLDPHNARTDYNRNGYEVSAFTIGGSSTNNEL